MSCGVIDRSLYHRQRVVLRVCRAPYDSDVRRDPVRLQQQHGADPGDGTVYRHLLGRSMQHWQRVVLCLRA